MKLTALRSLVSVSAFSVLAMSARDAAAQESPSTFSVELTSAGLVLGFRWDKEPGFRPGVSAEFKIHTTEHCFVMPLEGRDSDSNVKRRGVINNFTEARPYVDVWNYYQPTSSEDAKSEWRNSCPGDWLIYNLLPVQSSLTDKKTFYDSFGVFMDANEGNIGFGVHDASKFVAGKDYHLIMPLEPVSVKVVVRKSPHDTGVAIG